MNARATARPTTSRAGRSASRSRPPWRWRSVPPPCGRGTRGSSTSASGSPTSRHPDTRRPQPGARASRQAGPATRRPPASPELRAAVAQRYRKDFGCPSVPTRWRSPSGASRPSTSPARPSSTAATRSSFRRPTGPRSRRPYAWPGGDPSSSRPGEGRLQGHGARRSARPHGPKTKAVILNSPSNPTGAVIDPEELLVIGDMAQRRKFTLLYDDTYARLTFERGDTSPLAAARGTPRASVSSCSGRRPRATA